MIVVALGSVAHAGPTSNPAFLGIGLQDLGPKGPCQVTSVTKGSGAQEAGLRDNDIVMGLDGVATPTCVDLKASIVSHPAGDQIRLDVHRISVAVKLTINVTLSTRAEILHRRFVGQPLELGELVDIDNAKMTYDDSNVRGATSVIGWFILDSCTQCSRLFERVSDAIAARKLERPPFMLAVTASGMAGEPSKFRSTYTSRVPLAMARSRQDLTDFVLNDGERVSFMVVDCRGVVRFVTPIASDAEDLDAAIDEVLAAVDQAEHARTRR
ncbi:MAG: hypothetical protein JWO36_5622 [Myxococcales bacterium]|nr:hypothetical protein [Myxococcales bacterium]